MKTEPTQKTFRRRAVKILSLHTYIFTAVYGVMTVAVHPVFIVPTILYVWRSITPKRDVIYVFGPLYWAAETDNRKFSVGRGTMHELTDPWRKGWGLYLVVAKYRIHIGMCRAQKLGETEGILSAIQGRYLDVEPQEIRNWHSVRKEAARKLSA